MPKDYYNNDIEEFDPGRFYSDSAYTTPAENESRKRYQRKNVILSMLAGACVMATLASFVYMFFFYNVVVNSDTALDTNEFTEPSNSSAPPGFNISVDDMAYPDDKHGIEPPGVSFGHAITMNSGENTGDALTAKGIYRKCAPSVVSVSGSNADFTGFELGSGIIISEDGYIITANHLIKDSAYINVKLYGGGEYPAEIVGQDDASGIAVIKIEADKLLPAEFGDLSGSSVGESVVSIGNPIEGSFAITDGVISSLCGTIKYNGFPVTVFQTSAHSGSGCSGGPVINEFGQIIGMINADMASAYDLGNLSVAVPISIVKPIVDELLTNGYVAGRPALGLELIDIPLSVSAYYGMSLGVFVENVYEQSDAYTKGIARGDIIMSVNGVRISSVDALNEVKNELSVGDTLNLSIVRNRDIYSVDVELIDSADIGENK